MKNSSPLPEIHPSADVQSQNIGKGTKVWQFSIILPKAVIGEHCNINCHTYIENEVIIGNDVTIKSGVYLWDGIELENDVFIGPNVTFTNDIYPRSKRHPPQSNTTLVGQGASIGANATIIGGISIGKYALIGAGSVVTSDVPAFALVYGNPAKIKGWVDENGRKMIQHNDHYTNEGGQSFQQIGNQLIPVII